MARTLPSFFNYNRSFSPSEGEMFGITSDGTSIPVSVVEKTVRGAISNFSGVLTDRGEVDEKKAKKAATPDAANIQRIDVASLPAGCNQLGIRYSLVIEGNAAEPAGCNDPEMRRLAVETVARFNELQGFHELAARYAWAIINGRAMWRNRFANGKQVEVAIYDGPDRFMLSFDVDGIETWSYPGHDALTKAYSDFGHLVAAIERGLTAKRGRAVFLEVTMKGTLPPGAEVYPSQEFVDSDKGADKGVEKKGRKSKTLSSRARPDVAAGFRQATMHSQKIGNAIRTVDEWHGHLDEFGATAVEAFGYVQSRSATTRLKSKDGPAAARNVYDVFKDIEKVKTGLDGASSVADIPGDVLYLVAMMVRGGVFSGEKKA